MWIGWTPRTPGLHRIVARVLEKHRDRIPEDNETVLPVTVMAAALPDLSVTNFQGKAENAGSGKNNGTLQLRGHGLGPERLICVGLPSISPTYCASATAQANWCTTSQMGRTVRWE